MSKPIENKLLIGSKYPLESKTASNKNYRKVISTTKHMQLVLMSLKPDEDIPEETHANTTQFIRVEEGTASVIVNDRKNKLLPGDSIIIPPGTKHYVKNISESDLKLYTIYSPPEHKEGLTQKVKV